MTPAKHVGQRSSPALLSTKLGEVAFLDVEVFLAATLTDDGDEELALLIQRSQSLDLSH